MVFRTMIGFIVVLGVSAIARVPGRSVNSCTAIVRNVAGGGYQVTCPTTNCDESGTPTPCLPKSQTVNGIAMNTCSCAVPGGEPVANCRALWLVTAGGDLVWICRADRCSFFGVECEKLDPSDWDLTWQKLCSCVVK